MQIKLLPLVASVLVVFAAAERARADMADFERVPALEPNVAFWKRVYIEWSVNQIAFHDPDDLDLLYRVVAVPPVGEKDARGRTRPEVVRAAREEVQSALRSLAKKIPLSETDLSGVEREIFINLKNVKHADKYARDEAVRAQNGLREPFLQGWTNSGMYQGFIEAEMKRSGLPPELIGVAFVESLFFVGARSKVGAAGVWQFMSGTAREYMHRNAVVDERYDPMLATEAAAKYLRQAKKELGTWPLAVTSYNYGRSGMKQLVNAAGTTDFGVILSVSTAKRFGFAARNYYASFLAILDILKDKGTLLKGRERKPTWAYDVIKLPFPAFSAQLAAAGVDKKTLDALNPAITIEARDGKVPFPPGFSVRVPTGTGADVLEKLAALPDAEQKRGARAIRATHKANGKQTVADIARKFGVSAHTLSASLGLDAKARVAKGTSVAIPHASVPFTLLPEARDRPAPTLPPLDGPRVAAVVQGAQVGAPTPVVGGRARAEHGVESKTETTMTAAVAVLPRGKVLVHPIRVSALDTGLPAVDVIAGAGAVMLPSVDVIAGAPASDVPMVAHEDPTRPSVPRS